MRGGESLAATTTPSGGSTHRLRGGEIFGAVAVAASAEEPAAVANADMAGFACASQRGVHARAEVGELSHINSLSDRSAMSSKFPKLGPKEGFFSEFDIKYEGPATKNPLAFKYYNKDEVVLGKPMKEWLRFAVCYWHTWRGNGADIFGLGGSIKRPWDGDDMEAALTRVDVHFEFCQKLGIEYYCFHDRDVCPAEAASIEETEKDFDVVAEKMAARQAETGVKLLWGTCNLFSHKRYMHGAPPTPTRRWCAWRRRR